MSVSTILVGLDGSEGSSHAAGWTASLAADLGARVIACHVYEPLDHLDEIHPGTDFADIAEMLRERLAGPWTRAFREAGVTVSPEVIEGSPTAAIADAARRAGADLIVLGAVGRHPRRRHFGSTAMAMSDATTVPVTIIRPDEGTGR